MFPPEIGSLAQKTIDSYAARNRKIVTAESCTGGLIAAALTSIPGASAVVERGFVTYGNDAKFEVLGVMPELLESRGAVSAEVAEAMAVGALEFSRADIAVSATGIAGPTGGTPQKPIGLVYLGLAVRSSTILHCKCQFRGHRNIIRMQAVEDALKLLLSIEGSD